MPRKNTAAAASSATTVPSSSTTVPSSATTVPSSATTVSSSATTIPSSATTGPSFAITAASSTTTAASSSWSSIQSPPSTLTPIVSRQPGSPLSPSDRASYIDTIRYLQSENSRLKREVQITQKTVTREISNIETGYSVYNKRKLLDETDTERVMLELNIKRLRNDNEHLKSKLEKKTKNLQIAERNAVIHEKCSSDLHLNRMKERVDFAEAIISRVLCVSWKSPIEGSIFLPQTSAAYMQTQRRMNFSNIIHQALQEVLCMFLRGKNPLIDVSSGREDSPNSQASPLLSFVGASSSCQVPMISIPGDNSSEPKSFTYLLDCYSRIAIEERNHEKQSSVLLSHTLSDVVTILKEQCVQYSSRVLQGLTDICQAAVIPKCTTYLYYRILSQNLPRGYLRELVAWAHTNSNMFEKIFSPVLQHLYFAIQKASFYDNMPRRPIEALGELIEICSDPNSNIHPICRLITNQVQFLPDMTSAAGRELSRTSLLRPFLLALVSAEVQPKHLQRFFNKNLSNLNKSMRLVLQQELESTRMSLHKMFDTILANSSCRDITLAYLAALLRHNEKRAQIQTEDSPSFAGDGFMLNLLSILQMLSVNIKLDTVDPLYPFHPSNFVEIKNDTRLKLTLQEVAEWQKHLDSTHKWTEPNFPTQCWFLTLHCHHIALLPALQNYRRKLYESEHLQEMLDELQATESQWNDSPLAEHNEDLIKQQLKQLVTFKLCAQVALIQPIFLKRCLRFYILVAEFLLSLLTQTAPDNSLPKLPLSQKVMCKFTALPEWYMEDIVEFLLFTFKFCPMTWFDIDISPLITLLLVVVCTPHCIQNPHLIAKIIEVLYNSFKLYNVQVGLCRETETFDHKFMAHPISKMPFLASYLMKFYIDVEILHISSGFKDKLTICYHISVILNSLWHSPMHRASIVNESNNGKHFVKFINILMNDITFLLKKVLEHLKHILEVEEFMSDIIAWNAISQEQQQSRTRQLAADEAQARFSLTLIKEIVEMFHDLTVNIKEPFLRPELVGQLCAMLNFNLQQLCGSKSENLTVEKLGKYGWEPNLLFCQLIDIYLHLDYDNSAAASAIFDAFVS